MSSVSRVSSVTHATHATHATHPTYQLTLLTLLMLLTLYTQYNMYTHTHIIQHIYMCVCVVCVCVRPHRFWKISAPVYLLYKVTIKGTFEHVLPAIFSTPSTFIICAVSQKAASTCVREHILVRASTCILARERILVREGRPS